MRRLGGRIADLVEDFRGDFGQLEAVMEASWGQNETPPFLYTASFLADCLAYPEANFAMAPAIYDGEELVAFAAALPRRLMVDGMERRVAISGFLTVAPQYKSRGFGIIVWSELVRRAAQAGYEGMVTSCIEGEAMNGMIEGTAGQIGIPMIQVSSASYISRILAPRRSAEVKSRREASIGSFLHAAAAVPRNTPVSRLWTSEEADWQLRRVGGVSVEGGSEGDPAILAGYVLPIADPRHTRSLIVEDIFWGGLAEAERPILVQELLGRATTAGARIAIVPSLGYAALEPFVASGFRASTHVTNIYLTLWDGSMPAKRPRSCYIDVL